MKKNKGQFANYKLPGNKPAGTTKKFSSAEAQERQKKTKKAHHDNKSSRTVLF